MLRRSFLLRGIVASIALTAPQAIADQAPSSEPSSFLDSMAADNRPLRDAFTFELGFGASLTHVARERVDAHTGFGPTTVSAGAGFFVTPKIALLARWSGTTYFDKNASGETTQVINELGGIHLQYWANDVISISGGPALALTFVNPLLAADGDPELGIGGSARVGFSLFSAKHHCLRLSWETFNTKVANAFIYGAALSFEWQYF